MISILLLPPNPIDIKSTEFRGDVELICRSYSSKSVLNCDVLSTSVQSENNNEDKFFSEVKYIAQALVVEVKV